VVQHVPPKIVALLVPSSSSSSSSSSSPPTAQHGHAQQFLPGAHRGVLKVAGFEEVFKNAEETDVSRKALKQVAAKVDSSHGGGGGSGGSGSHRGAASRVHERFVLLAGAFVVEGRDQYGNTSPGRDDELHLSWTHNVEDVLSVMLSAGSSSPTCGRQRRHQSQQPPGQSTLLDKVDHAWSAEELPASKGFYLVRYSLAVPLKALAGRRIPPKAKWHGHGSSTKLVFPDASTPSQFYLQEEEGVEEFAVPLENVLLNIGVSVAIRSTRLPLPGFPVHFSTIAVGGARMDIELGRILNGKGSVVGGGNLLSSPSRESSSRGGGGGGSRSRGLWASNMAKVLKAVAKMVEEHSVEIENSALPSHLRATAAQSMSSPRRRLKTTSGEDQRSSNNDGESGSAGRGHHQHSNNASSSSGEGSKTRRGMSRSHSSSGHSPMADVTAKTTTQKVCMQLHKSGAVWKSLLVGGGGAGVATAAFARGHGTHAVGNRSYVRKAEWMDVTCNINLRHCVMSIRAGNDSTTAVLPLCGRCAVLQLLPFVTTDDVDEVSCASATSARARKLPPFCEKAQSFNRMFKLISPQGSLVVFANVAATSHTWLQLVKCAQSEQHDAAVPRGLAAASTGNTRDHMNSRSTFGAGRLSHYLFLVFAMAAVKFTRSEHAGSCRLRKGVQPQPMFANRAVTCSQPPRKKNQPPLALNACACPACRQKPVDTYMWYKFPVASLSESIRLIQSGPSCPTLHPRHTSVWECLHAVFKRYSTEAMTMDFTNFCKLLRDCKMIQAPATAVADGKNSAKSKSAVPPTVAVDEDSKSPANVGNQMFPFIQLPVNFISNVFVALSRVNVCCDVSGGTRTAKAVELENTSTNSTAAEDKKTTDILRMDFVCFYWSLVHIARHVRASEAKASHEVETTKPMDFFLGSSPCISDEKNRETRGEPGCSCHAIREGEANVLSRIVLCHVLPFLAVQRALVKTTPSVQGSRVRHSSIGGHSTSPVSRGCSRRPSNRNSGGSGRTNRESVNDADRQDSELLMSSTLSLILRKTHLGDTRQLERMMLDGMFHQNFAVLEAPLTPDRDSCFPLYLAFRHYSQLVTSGGGTCGPPRSKRHTFAPGAGAVRSPKVLPISTYCRMLKDFGVVPSFMAVEDVLQQVERTLESYHRCSLEEWLQVALGMECSGPGGPPQNAERSMDFFAFIECLCRCAMSAMSKPCFSKVYPSTIDKIGVMFDAWGFADLATVDGIVNRNSNGV
jgi:hypothetical protein